MCGHVVVLGLSEIVLVPGAVVAYDVVCVGCEYTERVRR